MKRKCDKCSRPATYHCVEVTGGKKVEKHLCDLHATEEGMSIKPANAPISELLTNFEKHVYNSESQASPSAAAAGGKSGPKMGTRLAQDMACANCGVSFTKFREKSLLGCPECYRAFERPLSPLLERAHEGGSHHVGKVPRRAGVGEQRQLLITRMRQRLDEAVAGEDYELAAKLRDEIHRFESDLT